MFDTFDSLLLFIPLFLSFSKHILYLQDFVALKVQYYKLIVMSLVIFFTNMRRK
jgi:hypothetical protein